MKSTPLIPTLTGAAALSPEMIVELIRENVLLKQQLAAFKHQIEWFQRQIFGQKSEKRFVDESGQQMSLGKVIELPQTGTPPEAPTRIVAAHARQAKPTDAGSEAVPFFDESRVPVEIIELANPELDGLTPEQFEIIGTKDSIPLPNLSKMPPSSND